MSQPTAERSRRGGTLLKVLVAIVVLAGCCAATFAIAHTTRPAGASLADRAKTTLTATAKVEERVVDDSVVLPVAVHRPSTSTVVYSGTPDKPVITRTSVAKGQSVAGGTFLGTVANQPVFAVTEPVAMFRDLRVGDSGDDVRALQRTLTQLGHPVTPDGKLGTRTMDAAKALFHSAGYDLPVDAAAAAASADTSSASGSGQPSSGGNSEQSGAEAEVAQPSDPGTARTPSAPDGRLIPLGTFAAIPAQGGQVVRTAKQGTVLAADTAWITLASGDSTLTFRADATVSGQVAKGQQLSVQGSGEAFKAKVASIGAFKDQDSSGQLPGRDVVLTPEGGVTKGQLAQEGLKVRLGAVPKPSMAIPATALRQDGQGSYVLKMTGQQEQPTLRVEVTPQHTAGGWVGISSTGLHQGDEVQL